MADLSFFLAVALSYAFVAIPFVIAIVFAFVIWLLTISCYSSPLVGVWFSVVMYLFNAMGAGGSLNLGLNINTYDICMMIIGFVTMIRVAQGHIRWREPINRAWMVLGIVWFALFAIGTVQYKTLAGLQFREPFYLLAAAGYLMSFDLDDQQVRRIFNALLVAGIVMSMLALSRWILVAAGEYDWWYDYHVPLRVLSSSGAQLIAMSMLPGVAMWLGLAPRRMGWMLLTPLLLLVVVLLTHRTVWISSIAAIGAGWWLAGRNRSTRSSGLLVPLLVGVMVIGGFFVAAPESTVSRELTRSVTETQQKNSTFAWRQDSWKSLVSNWAAAGPLVWPAGYPFGKDQTRYVESQGMETQVAAHSQYVSLLTNGGLLGLGFFLVAQWRALRRMLAPRQTTGEEVRPEVLILPLVFALVYGIGYSLDYMQGLMMGLAFSFAVHRAPENIARASTRDDASIHAYRGSPHLS